MESHLPRLLGPLRLSVALAFQKDEVLRPVRDRMRAADCRIFRFDWDASPLSGRQIAVNRLGRAAARSHGENDRGSSGHDIAASEDACARSALGLESAWM